MTVLTPTTSLLPKILASVQLADTAAHAIYTCPASTTAVIRQAAIANATGVPQQATTMTGSALSTSVATTALAVAALTSGIPQGSQAVSAQSGNQQTWVTSADAAPGATSLSVVSQIAFFAFAAGATVTPGGVTVTVRIAIVPSGLTDDGKHTIVPPYTLAFGDSLPLTGLLAGATLQPGDAIWAQASAPYAANILISGAEGS